MATISPQSTLKPLVKEGTNHTRGPWRINDLDLLPENNNRYEIINGELFVEKPAHWNHQVAAGNSCVELTLWNEKVGLGQSVIAPGIVFSDSDSVIPDGVWISNERLSLLLNEDGHLTGAPELAIEVLSFGTRNEERDRTAKLRLYEAQGVREYWILDWRFKQVEVYRRQYGELSLVMTLLPEDRLTSPLLPGFECSVLGLFD